MAKAKKTAKTKPKRLKKKMDFSDSEQLKLVHRIYALEQRLDRLEQYNYAGPIKRLMTWRTRHIQRLQQEDMIEKMVRRSGYFYRLRRVSRHALAKKGKSLLKLPLSIAQITYETILGKVL